MRFAIFQATSVGDRRKNEDRAGYAYSRDALLMMVADGMGGHVSGDRAAEVAVQVLAKAFSLAAKPTVDDPAAFLAHAFIEAHFAVNALVAGDRAGSAGSAGSDQQPRTTLVAALVQNGQLWIAHVGDSRLYHLRNGRVTLRTTDHSQAQLLLQQGLLTEADLRYHPSRNRLLASIGGEEVPRVEFTRRVTLQHNDVVALCSDGLWGQVDDEEIAKRLSVPNLEWATKALVEEAVTRAMGHSDNVTLLTMRWLETAHESLDAVFTETTAGVVTSIFSEMDDAVPSDLVLSDDEVDRAIQEINETIEKFRRNR